MRFSMGLNLSSEENSSVAEIETSCGRHISIVNDIYNFRKEELASRQGHKEGGFLCSAVSIFGAEASLSISATTRVLWVMCREWEYVHEELVANRIAAVESCSDTLRSYMDALQYQMSGNELWSQSTRRYQDVAD